jgi:hypothetical protein
MNSSKIYEDYTSVLMELNELQDSYRKLSGDTDSDGREKLQTKITSCREKLTTIVERLIHHNPFMSRRGTTARGALNE